MVSQYYNKLFFVFSKSVCPWKRNTNSKNVFPVVSASLCYTIVCQCYCLCSVWVINLCACVCIRVLSHTTLLEATGFLALQHTRLSFLSCLKLLRGWCVRDEMNKNHLDAAEVYRQRYKQRKAGRTAQQQGSVYQETLHLAFYNRKNNERVIL